MIHTFLRSGWSSPGVRTIVDWRLTVWGRQYRLRSGAARSGYYRTLAARLAAEPDLERRRRRTP